MSSHQEGTKELSADDIRSGALALPEAERADLIEVLIDSLRGDPEVESAWIEEVQRRYDEILRGDAELIDNDDVFAELRREAERNQRVRELIRRAKPDQAMIDHLQGIYDRAEAVKRAIKAQSPLYGPDPAISPPDGSSAPPPSHAG